MKSTNCDFCIKGETVGYVEVEQFYSNPVRITLKRIFASDDIRFIYEQSLLTLRERSTFNDWLHMNHFFFKALQQECDNQRKGAATGRIMALKKLFNYFTPSATIRKALTFNAPHDTYTDALNEFDEIYERLSSKLETVAASLLMEIMHECKVRQTTQGTQTT